MNKRGSSQYKTQLSSMCELFLRINFHIKKFAKLFTCIDLIITKIWAFQLVDRSHKLYNKMYG